MVQCKLQSETIDVAMLLSQCTNPSDGAVVCFIGKPRNIDNDREVLYLEYETHESMAKKEIDAIMKKAIELYGIHDCIVVHRLGKVNIGEISIVIVVTSMHRKDAYDASQYIINEIKKTVPIWKKEYFVNGAQWKSG